MRPSFAPLLLLFACAFPAHAATPDDDLAAYASMGSAVATNMRFTELGWTDAQFAAFLTGFRSAFEGKPYPANEATRRLFAETQESLAARDSALASSPSAPAPSSSPASTHFDRLDHYLATARENFELQKTSSGLLYRINGGSGPRPRPQDTIVINLSAKAPDGTSALPQLSSSGVRTKVADLLPGLAEGVQMIALGGRGFFVLPPHLSFGKGPWPAGLEPGMPLIYELDLTDIVTTR
jgi:FKBP-type peptidyl-prolyl cis-trans isomerase